MLDSLPDEIIEQIYGYIKGGPRELILDHVSTLLHLALTCRRLYLVGKPFLHETVCLDAQSQCCGFLHPKMSSQIQPRTLRRLFVGSDAWRDRDSSGGLILLDLFPNLEELAWIQTIRETVSVGHHLTRMREADTTGHVSFASAARYHLIVPNLYWIDLAPMILPRDTFLEYLTVTVWTGSQPIAPSGQTEHALSWLFQHYSHLKDVCIRIGHNATGFGSRIERMKRSFSISNAVRQLNDDRVRLEVAQYMFGTKNLTHSEDIFTCLKASWMESLEEDGLKSGRSFARYCIVNTPLQ